MDIWVCQTIALLKAKLWAFFYRSSNKREHVYYGAEVFTSQWDFRFLSAFVVVPFFL